MTNINQENIRGALAANVLDNEVYKEAFATVRNGIISAWENAPIRDKDGQGELKLMLKLLNDVQKNIENVMQTGKMAKIMIERESLMEKAKRRFG